MAEEGGGGSERAAEAGDGSAAEPDGSGARDGKPGEGTDAGGTDKGPAKPPVWKRPLFWLIFIAALLIILVVAIAMWIHSRRYESTDDAFVDAHIIRIAPQVSGLLVAVADADNRHVKPGQLLAVVEASGPEAQLAGARAELAEADAGIRQAEARVLAARAQVSQAEKDAEAPAAAARRAADDYARYRTLRSLDAAAAAPTQIDAARAEAEATAAQAAAARRQVETQRANVLVARRQVEAARAQRSAALARIQQVGVTVGDLRITAPVAGQVVNRSVNLGSYVSPGTQLMSLVPDQMWVTANFKETQITLMQRGQPVSIEVDAFPGIEFHGHVDSIQRGAGQAFAVLPAQNATGNFVKVVQRVPVRILFDRPDPLRYAIGPGMSVEATVQVRP
jgi:membrane fusion protein, multidrug efflux system